MSKKFLVRFDTNSFADLIMSANFFISKYYLQERSDYKYLLKYLTKLECQFVYLEPNYISETFTEDYQHFYSIEYRKNTKFTARIHFFRFSSILNEDTTLKDFINLDTSEVQRVYLGYLVVKPISNSFWGVTMLTTFNTILDRSKKFNSLITDSVNLFNHELSIQTLPFQQQDNAISECATASLWTTLFYSHKKFRRSYLSMAALSKMISKGTPYVDGYRKSPLFLGLNSSQITSVVVEFGLIMHYFNINDLDEQGGINIPFKQGSTDIIQNDNSINRLSRIIYAYNKSGFPVLLGFSINDTPENTRHLVVVTGYEISNTTLHSGSIFADRIRQLYVHDDQFGMFCKVDYHPDPDIWTCENIKFLKIHCLDDEPTNFKLATPTNVYIPVSKKIKLSFDDVYIMHLKIHLCFIQLTSYFLRINGIKQETIIADIFIERGSDYKRRILNDYKNQNRIIREISQQSYPQFIWVVSFLNSQELFCDIIIDSTTVKDSYPFIQLILYCNNLNTYLRKQIKHKDVLIELDKWINNTSKTDLINHFVYKFFELQLSISAYKEMDMNKLYNSIKLQ